MRALRFLALACTLGTSILAACTEDGTSGVASSGGDGGPSSTSDGGSTPPPDAASSNPDGGSPSDAAAAAAGPGIQLEAGGTSYALDQNTKAAQASNGWLIQGGAVENGTGLRSMAIILNKAEAGQNGPTYVEPTPGTYACTQPGAAPFTWARFQYTTPNGTTYQSPSTAGAPCSVTLTEFGAVNAAVKGSFSATLDRVAGADAAQIDVTGTFDVVRAN